MKTKFSACGFTLIELLAVIAIILVLLAFLVPGLATTRERGQRAVCYSNMRQLQIAFNFITTDRNGLLLSSATSGTNSWTSEPDLKIGPVWDYTQNENIYRCPAYPTLPSGVVLKRTYSLATRIGSDDWVRPVTEKLVSLSSVRRPAATHAFVEEYDNRTSGTGPAPGPRNGFAQNRSGYSAVDCIPTWHSMGANFTYLDGHVEYRRWEGPTAPTIDCYTWFNAQMGLSFGGTAADKSDWDFILSGINNAY